VRAPGVACDSRNGRTGARPGRSSTRTGPGGTCVLPWTRRPGPGGDESLRLRLLDTDSLTAPLPSRSLLSLRLRVVTMDSARMGPFKVLACPSPNTYRLAVNRSRCCLLGRVFPEFKIQRLRPHLRGFAGRGRPPSAAWDPAAPALQTPLNFLPPAAARAGALGAPRRVRAACTCCFAFRIFWIFIVASTVALLREKTKTKLPTHRNCRRLDKYSSIVFSIINQTFLVLFFLRKNTPAH
jgi:hypothetical protein